MSEDHKTYEMLWDCQFCGTTKNLGKTHRFCPNCGAPQEPDSRYYPSDEEKVAVEDHQFVGKDVTCPACGALNSGDAHNCGNCGSPLEQGAAASTLDAQKRSEREAFESSGSRDVQRERYAARMEAAGVELKQRHGEEPEEKKGRNPIVLIGALVGILAVCGGLAFAFTRTSEATVIVTGHSWEREIEIEAYQQVRDEDWRDAVPSDAYSLRCSERERGTERVDTGRETCETVRIDQGDGTFREEQECEPVFESRPVMDDYCTYNIDRWEIERVVTTDGDSLSDNPVWGDADINTCSRDRVGCEREGDHSENYTVSFRSTENNDTFRCNVSQSEWENIAIDSVWTGESRVVAGGLVCDSLERTN